MALEDLLVDATLLLLLASALILAVDFLRKPAGRKAVNDFSILMLVFVAGWFSTALLTGLDEGVFGLLVNLAYLFVLVVFAAAMTRRLSLAVKQAAEPIVTERELA